MGINATGVYSQKKTSVIEGSVNRCSQTKCLYFVLELNQILLLTGDTVIHKGEDGKDIILKLISLLILKKQVLLILLK